MRIKSIDNKTQSQVVNNLIFDVGAHKGEDCDLFLTLGFKVIAVEANPALVNILGERFKRDVNRGQLHIIDKAISDRTDKVTFYMNKVISIWGTVDKNWAHRNKVLGFDSETIRVPTTTLIKLIKKYGCPFYLKVDIEGADLTCIKQLFSVSCRPTYISIESTKNSWHDLLSEFETLVNLGYTKFKVINQKKHPKMVQINKHNLQIDYVLEQNSSGLFGDYLEGKWLTKNQAIVKYLPIYFLYIVIGDNTLLSKIIKYIPVVNQILNFVSWYDTHAMREQHPVSN